MPQPVIEVVNPIPAEEIPGWARVLEAAFLRDRAPGFAAGRYRERNLVLGRSQN